MIRTAKICQCDGNTLRIPRRNHDGGGSLPYAPAPTLSTTLFGKPNLIIAVQSENLPFKSIVDILIVFNEEELNNAVSDDCFTIF